MVPQLAFCLAMTFADPFPGYPNEKVCQQLYYRAENVRGLVKSQAYRAEALRDGGLYEVGGNTFAWMNRPRVEQRICFLNKQYEDYSYGTQFWHAVWWVRWPNSTWKQRCEWDAKVRSMLPELSREEFDSGFWWKGFVAK